MAKPVISGFNEMAELLIQKYERYLPTAFDESLSLLEKVNKIIQYLNETGVLVNGVVTQWNEVMEWVMNEGLEEEVNERLDEMTADGTLDAIINQNIFNDLNTKIDGVIADVDTRFGTMQTELDQDFADFQETIEADIDNRFGDINTWRNHYKVIDNTGTPAEVTARLQDALNNTDGVEWIVLDGDYNVNAQLTGFRANIISRNARLLFSNAGDGLHFAGKKRAVTLTAQGGYTQGRNYLLVQGTAGVSQGDLLHFYSTSDLYNSSRSYYYKGSNLLIDKIASDRFYFAEGLPYDISAVDLVEAYEPGRVRILGNLRIQNTGALPNGVTGLMLMYCADSIIDGVMADNFDTCISATRSTGVKFINCRTRRAYYTGTGQSYGFMVASANKITYENCHTLTGRHGFASGGWETCHDIHIRNCSFFSEAESGSRSFDMHNNMVNALVENTECDSFQLFGNIVFKNFTVHGREIAISLLAQADFYERASYSFDGLTVFNGARIEVGSYAQSGGSITGINKIGAISVRNAKGNLPWYLKCDSRGYGGAGIATVRAVSIQDSVQMGFLFGDHVDGCTLTNMIMEADATMIVQTKSDALLKSCVIQACKFPARYLAVSITNALRLSFISCHDQSTGNAAPRFAIAGPNTHVAFINSQFNNLSEGIDLSVNTYMNIGSSYSFYGTPVGTALTL
jgi:hypothetical protein